MLRIRSGESELSLSSLSLSLLTDIVLLCQQLPPLSVSASVSLPLSLDDCIDRSKECCVVLHGAPSSLLSVAVVESGDR